MNRTADAPTSKKSLFHWFWLLQGLGWISSLGILGSIAVAQTSTQPATKALAIPETEPQSDKTAPIVSQPALPIPASSPIPATSPAIDPPQERAVPTVVLPSPQSADTYEKPLSIILSERSTGCQNTVELGQGVEGTCAVAKPAAIVPPEEQLPVANVGQTRKVGEPSAVVSAGIESSARESSGLVSAIDPIPTIQDYYSRTLRPPGRLGNGNISLIFPLAIPAPISSLFGWRMHPISGDRRFHSGTDLGAPLGTPVLAAYAGQVAIADFLGGYGLAVTLNHNQGTQQTLYAHLSEIFVKPGETVKQGDVIGRVGSTGNSTGPHLHFEFRQLTPDGWLAMDAGTQLESALAQLVKTLETAQTQPQLGTITQLRGDRAFSGGLYLLGRTNR
jgi:murein DD-endopeptidase MepM/ murein hydrolase activator NlpD